MSEKSQWMLVEKLQSTMPQMDEYAMAKASNLIGWHSEHGYLTQKQQGFARILLTRTKEKRTQKANHRGNEHYLYAISDGVAIKLGFSRSPSKRLKDMQTGHPMKLQLLWMLGVGESPAKARKAERKLHRYCRKFRKRGEWFELACAPVVEKFEIREKEHRQRVKQDAAQKQIDNENQEREILAAARERI